MPFRRDAISRTCALLLVILVAVHPVLAQRTDLKPGWNLFSPEDDVAMGRQVAEESERELNLVEDAPLAEYVNRLGLQLAAEAPGERYPYQFKLVNDSAINAFALPGGFIYLNRGVIEAADREAEVAGVLAHEIGHVVLRHGTNQASRAYIAQAPLAILGGIFGGGNGIGAVLANVGVGLGATAFFNRFSRDAERQADLMGAQILYDAGYDATGMTEFFEKIAAQGGSRGLEFLSSHPDPGNRIESVSEEIGRLGSRPPVYLDNASEFRRVKARMTDLPPAPERGSGSAAESRTQSPPLPSDRLTRYRASGIELAHPVNWSVSEGEDSVTFAPEGGVHEDGSLAYGLIVSRFEAAPDARGQIELEDAADQLIDRIREANPSLRVSEGYRRTRLGGRSALLAGLRSESPRGGRERDVLVTALATDAVLYYLIAVAPENEFEAYQETFEAMLDSFRFR